MKTRHIIKDLILLKVLGWLLTLGAGLESRDRSQWPESRRYYQRKRRYLARVTGRLLSLQAESLPAAVRRTYGLVYPAQEGVSRDTSIVVPTDTLH